MKRLGIAVASVLMLAIGGLLSAQTRPVATAPAPTPSAAPTATAPKPMSDLKIMLMDGSLLTGKMSVTELAIDTKFGALKVPVEQIVSFAPGLQSHPQFQQTLNGLITDLAADVFSDREKAQAALTKLGPDIRGELERQLKGAENERQMRLQKILDDFDAAQSDDEVDKSRLWVKEDVIVTQGFTVVGHITTPSFSVNSAYGTLQIKLEDVRDARRDVAEPEEIRKNIAVPGSSFASRSYVTTNIKLAKGDQVFITAGGTVAMTPWNQQSTPEGAQNFGTIGSGIYGGTLIGKIGDSGPMIKIGSKLNFTASTSGILQLSIASQGNYEGNNFPGEYQVKIRVIKK